MSHPQPLHPYCPHCFEVRIHPQPFYTADGRFLCGACWFLEGIESEMKYSAHVVPLPDEVEGLSRGE